MRKRNLVPCLEWMRYPITLLLSARGCAEDARSAAARGRPTSASAAAARQLFDHADDPSALTHAVLELANHRAMFGDDELKWPVAGRFRVGAALLRGLASGLVREVGHTAARAVGRFDTAARLSR